ncbi:uncharacterized protein BJ171DRAFT_597264 [Polychytrium aggregatum]|uniref:uncharacterized protein n=1 Tax=Polychytrium aggregatum TaxID=110093 RepID=UPI0022FE34EE|nr:uncharacterized protein BJ171DRAFT_597264 [Polychytrium aggregatum]KAI9206591.1 hypothetical protein BJ171DRAFT_597264 [Polychytrium aggregatum]
MSSNPSDKGDRPDVPGKAAANTSPTSSTGEFKPWRPLESKPLPEPAQTYTQFSAAPSNFPSSTSPVQAATPYVRQYSDHQPGPSSYYAQQPSSSHYGPSPPADRYYEQSYARPYEQSSGSGYYSQSPPASASYAAGSTAGYRQPTEYGHPTSPTEYRNPVSPRQTQRPYGDASIVPTQTSYPPQRSKYEAVPTKSLDYTPDQRGLYAHPEHRQTSSVDKRQKTSNARVLDPASDTGYDRRPKDRRYCCCFRTRRGCCTFSILLTILILVGLGLAVYFLYPRFPTINVSSPFLLNSSAGLTTLGSLGSASAASPFVLSFGFAVNITVNSQNYIDIFVSSLTVNINLLDNNGNPLSSVKGTGVANNFNIRSFQTSVVTLPTNVSYTTTSPVSVKNIVDPDFLVLESSCVGSTPFNFKYTGSLTIPLISWTGYHPSFDGTFTQDCPSAMRTAIASLINGGSFL